LPEVISQFSQNNSGITFETVTLHYEEIQKQLLELKVDLGVVYDHKPHRDITSTTIDSGEFVVIAPDSFFPGKDEVNISDISSHPFIKITDKIGPRGPLGSKLDEYLSRYVKDLNIIFNTETFQVALALVSKNMGITITDRISAESSSKANIKILNLKPDLKFTLEVIHVKSNPLSLINKKFINFLEGFNYSDS
jgi:DNA-binding transcriptional LysR family regulator